MPRFIISFESEETARQVLSELNALRVPRERVRVESSVVPTLCREAPAPTSVFAHVPIYARRRTVVAIDAEDGVQANKIRSLMRLFGPLDVCESRQAADPPRRGGGCTSHVQGAVGDDSGKRG